MIKATLAVLLTLMLGATATAATIPVVDLNPSNLLMLRDEVSDESVTPLILQLMSMRDRQVVLYINSPGGSIIAGFQLINAMKASGKRITCVAEFAASMAFSILQACDVRFVVPGVIIMQHQASSALKGSLTEMRTQLTLTEKLADKLNRDDASRLGMPVADFKKRIHDEWWMFDTDAIEAKAADSQALAKCSAKLSAQTTTQVVSSLFGSATFTWSACPLATFPIAIKIERLKDADLRDFNEWVKELHLDQDWKTKRIVK